MKRRSFWGTLKVVFVLALLCGGFPIGAYGDAEKQDVGQQQKRVIALTDLGMGGQFWWIVMVYVLIAQVIVDNFILIPILISRVSNLHPLWVLLAIIMGGKLYGVLGMIIGVPIASIIKIAILETRHYRRTFQLPEQIAEPDRHH